MTPVISRPTRDIETIHMTRRHPDLSIHSKGNVQVESITYCKKGQFIFPRTFGTILEIRKTNLKGRMPKGKPYRGFLKGVSL